MMQSNEPIQESQPPVQTIPIEPAPPNYVQVGTFGTLMFAVTWLIIKDGAPSVWRWFKETYQSKNQQYANQEESERKLLERLIDAQIDISRNQSVATEKNTDAINKLANSISGHISRSDRLMAILESNPEVQKQIAAMIADLDTPIDEEAK